jgi:histidyl-tRNA synthetase
MAIHANRNILGLKNIRLLINSLGCGACRPAYRQTLMAFLDTLDLDEATRTRAKINPLRVLDDKRPDVQAQLIDAPLMPDHLCAECETHHIHVLAYLDALGVVYEKAPRLVRGLDYYVRTTFELVHDGLGAQSAIGGGGRYDGLIETLGGPAIGGIGFGLGVDRTCLAVQSEGIDLTGNETLDVFVIALGEGTNVAAVKLLGELRSRGISGDFAFDGRSIKAAMKGADRSGAKIALILGEDELSSNSIVIKDLTTGEQSTTALDLVVDALVARFN